MNPAFVSSNENDNNLNITIKEETSGKDQVNMYYYKLERKNGQVKLIPMLFLNKAILNDSTADKKAPVNAHTKMRITL